MGCPDPVVTNEGGESAGDGGGNTDRTPQEPGIEAAPEPTPEPDAATPEPQPEPAPEPTPEPTPEPQPEPTAKEDCAKLVPLCTAATATKIEDSKITAPTTYDGCYLVTRTVTISAEVTVKPGTVFLFAQNASFSISTNGTFNAVGTDQKHICFVGETAQKGHWKGLYFATKSTKNELSYVEIRHTGSSSFVTSNYPPASVFVNQSGSVKISTSVFADSTGVGVHTREGAELPAFASNKFEKLDKAALHIHAQAMGSLDSQTTYAEAGDTSEPFVLVQSGNVVASPITISSLDVPYRIDTNVQIKAAVTIDPGATLEFTQNVGIQVTDQGTLTAKGTKDDKIRFVGATPNKGFWKGLYFATKSNKNELFYVEIRHTGSSSFVTSNYPPASVFVDQSGSVKISISVFADSTGVGIHTREGAELPAFASNKFEKLDKAALHIHAQAMGSLDSQSTYAEAGDTSEPFVLVQSGNEVASPITIPSLDVPYRIDTIVQIKAEVIVALGASFEFTQGNAIQVTDQGTLTAVGTKAKPIRFLGATPTKGHWKGLYFATKSTKNELSYVEIRHTGSSSFVTSNYPPASVFVSQSGVLKLTNNVFADSAGVGVHTREGAELPGFASNKFEKLDKAALHIHPQAMGSLDSQSTYAEAGDTSEPFVLVQSGNVVASPITIPSLDVPYRIDTTLRIRAAVIVEAGTTIELTQNVGIQVETGGQGGSLETKGTQTSQVTFTGVNKIQGYWKGIYFSTLSNNNKLTHTLVEYGGSQAYITSNYTPANIFVAKDSNVTFAGKCVLKDSRGVGITTINNGLASGLANVTFTNNKLGNTKAH